MVCGYTTRWRKKHDVSDYDMDTGIEPEWAENDLQSARRFVARVETYLSQEGWQ